MVLVLGVSGCHAEKTQRIRSPVLTLNAWASSVESGTHTTALIADLQLFVILICEPLERTPCTPAPADQTHRLDPWLSRNANDCHSSSEPCHFSVLARHQHFPSSVDQSDSGGVVYPPLSSAHGHKRRSSAYAYGCALDAWVALHLQQRGVKLPAFETRGQRATSNDKYEYGSYEQNDSASVVRRQAVAATPSLPTHALPTRPHGMKQTLNLKV
ncbi:hypothetical protein AYO21_09152 [Fonsecaea monophora]|uniref:Uncharacterized protein n=1 Tax=Fonsecaea monophora TaxID=254056 RepID=A0A177EXA0_9EURO|nr:hypothetical protein AYO21_09152 [Fonsecaea monophora]OAG36677.1 hypothetical protein AYO21_09152 [Fonsecaea monophora]